MKHHYDGELTRAELLEDAPVGLYRVKDAVPRWVEHHYDPVTDMFRNVQAVPIARVRMAEGRQMPLVGECYQRGDRQVIFVDVPVDEL